MRSREDNKGMGRLRKALHTAVRLHRHSRLHSAKTGKAASACQNMHTVEGQPETQTQNELQTKIVALVDSVSSKHQNGVPRPPKVDEDAWTNWEEECVNECGKAAKQKERIVQLLKQKDGIAARRHIQAMYNSNQKLWNKKILKGDTNNVTLNAVLYKITGQMLYSPDMITDYVHEAFQ